MFEIIFMLFFAMLIVFVFYRLHLVIKDAQDTRDYYFNKYKEILGDVNSIKKERNFHAESNLKLELENRELRQKNSRMRPKLSPIKQGKIINEIRKSIQSNVTPNKFDQINSLLNRLEEVRVIEKRD